MAKFISLAMTLSLLLIIAPGGVMRISGEKSPFPEVDVFHAGEQGYFCIKIPYLFTTVKGTLLAFGEARRYSCSDFTSTDLVLKRSFDNGTTWTELQVVYSNTSTTQNYTIGNAAPLQLKVNKRILVPFCRDNRAVFQTYSDDDGSTWSAPEALPGGSREGWQWVATGPPGGMQLQSGRLVVPSYHSYVNNTDGTIDRVHMMINDNPYGNASDWYIGGVAPGLFWSSECQAVELEPNHLLIASRGFLTSRIQIESFDGGSTLQEPYWTDIVEPLGGCEGSIVYHKKQEKLFFSGNNNPDPRRFNMTIFESTNKGKSWDVHTVINQGRTGYSSMVIMPDGESVGLLYERSNLTNFIFQPTHFSFLVVWPKPGTLPGTDSNQIAGRP